MKNKLFHKTKSIFVLCLFILGNLFLLQAQENSTDSIVFSIDDQAVYKSEFVSQYKKNNNSDFENEDLNLEDYADLYLKFKLKVKAAKEIGLDTVPEFLKEFGSYRKQLADKYISNGDVTEKMVKETYHRLTNEVNASHILIAVSPQAQPVDTLEAYNTAIDILKKIDAGESFEDLATKFSKDPSVQVNKGNMGWFKAYKMVYPFETAAYNLDINEVSQPVKTQFGYHIIKKNDERPSKGKLKVAHIMKNLKSQDSTYDAESEIQKIYQKLQNGENFGDLAKQFTDHKQTAEKGGEISPFSIGQLNSAKFEEVAFNLDENNSLSKPFKTEFGWHIIKYLDHIPVEPLEEIKQDIIQKIKTSDRSQRLIENIKKDLMDKYDVSTNYEVLSGLENRIDESILKFKWNYESKDKDKETWILKIDEKEYMLDEFLTYIQKQQRAIKSKDIQDKINNAIDKFTYAKLIDIHNKNLENVSPEFAAEIKTYYEGLLLFNVMEQHIWKPTQNDTVALEKYYNLHPDKFMSKISIDGIMASSNSKQSAKKIKKEIDKKSIDVLKENYPESIFKTLEKTEIDDVMLPENLVLEIDNIEIYKHNGQYLCLQISNIHPSKLLEFDEVKGKVINLLQKEREDEWLADLEQKHDIYINNDLIKNLQQQLEN